MAKYHKRSGYKFLKEEEFNKIKALLNAGFGNAEVRKIMVRSYNLVKDVQDAEDFADYKENQRLEQIKIQEKAKAKLEEVEPETQETPAEPTHLVGKTFPVGGVKPPVPMEDTTVKEILEAINFNLREVNKRLKKIEHNQSSPNKKRRIF